MQVKVDIKRLQQQVLHSNANSSKCKLDVATTGRELLLALRSEFKRQWDETQKIFQLIDQTGPLEARRTDRRQRRQLATGGVRDDHPV